MIVCIYVCVYSVNIDIIMQERVSGWECWKQEAFCLVLWSPP